MRNNGKNETVISTSGTDGAVMDIGYMRRFSNVFAVSDIEFDNIRSMNVLFSVFLSIACSLFSFAANNYLNGLITQQPTEIAQFISGPVVYATLAFAALFCCCAVMAYLRGRDIIKKIKEQSRPSI